MTRLTLHDARDTLARALGICPATSTRVTDLANEAQQRLLNRPGKPVGSFVRYRFRVNESCIILPRHIRSVERFSICERPGMLLPEWFEFQFNATGQLESDDNIGDKMIDHGTDCKFNDFTAGQVDRKIRVVTDLAEDALLYIWLFGYDENSNWIRTQVGGVWVDGERIELSTAPVTSTNYFTRLVRVIKDATDGTVRLYEWNATTAAIVQALAYYEPSETSPIYRRVYIPGLADMGTCPDQDDCDDKQITIFARLQHIPVSHENDAFVIGNVAALKLMCLAIKAEEEQRLPDAATYQMMAERELDGELAAYLGDGMRIGINFEDRKTWGPGDVENVL